ncbi:MAG TPA: lamin tail domain-containing protein, partial [Chitinophagaceae bacterium]|nr:lamin tail domain-containing protein [Chitinophagaceae bacterium]
SILLFLIYTRPCVAQVVINEILFNPKPGGWDYVELYNRSDSSINLSAYFLTNRNSSGQYGPLKKLCDSGCYLPPKGYVVFTENAADLALRFFVKNPAAVIEIASLPSYANAAGTVVLMDSLHNVIDAVTYNEDWQFNLLTNAEGVALERIDPSGKSGDKSNWRSAASDAGYGTPGYQNSNFKLFQKAMLTVAATPTIFSPDGDGIADVATLSYTTPENSFVANVFIYNVSGRQVRHLVKGALLGTAGTFTWNGLDENGQLLPVGQYIIYTEIFNLQGTKQGFKNVVVLARRLH